jgi:hypothetical protein
MGEEAAQEECWRHRLLQLLLECRSRLLLVLAGRLILLVTVACSVVSRLLVADMAVSMAAPMSAAQVALVGVQHKRRSLVVLGLRDKGTMVVPVHRGLMVAAVAAKDRLVRLLHQVKAAMVWRRRLLVQASLMQAGAVDAHRG